MTREHSSQEHGMVGWLRGLDSLLRGDATRMTALRQGIIDVAPDGLTLLILALGALYGGCMGSYALFRPQGASWPQFFMAMGKVPLLFLLTLLVTLPSLYVFNALVGSRLSLSSVFRLIVASVAVMLAVLASFGPIVAFFSASTTGYSFMLLLNVGVFAVAGGLGMKFLLTTLHRLSLVALEVAAAEVEVERGENLTPLDAKNAEEVDAEASEMQPALAAQVTPGTVPPLSAPPYGASPYGPVPHGMVPQGVPPYGVLQGVQHHAMMPMPPVPAPRGALAQADHRAPGADVLRVFRIWMIMFGLVGAQMGWVLRPFLGAPGRGFSLFSPRESNFFEAVFHQLLNLLGGH